MDIRDNVLPSDSGSLWPLSQAHKHTHPHPHAHTYLRQCNNLAFSVRYRNVAVVTNEYVRRWKDCDKTETGKETKMGIHIQFFYSLSSAVITNSHTQFLNPTCAVCLLVPLEMVNDKQSEALEQWLSSPQNQQNKNKQGNYCNSHYTGPLCYTHTRTLHIKHACRPTLC